MTDSAKPTLLIVDGHSLAYRAFFALPVENFSTTTGQPTNAVYGFTSMLINCLRDEDPTHVAVAFDAGNMQHVARALRKLSRRERRRRCGEPAACWPACALSRGAACRMARGQAPAGAALRRPPRGP